MVTLKWRRWKIEKKIKRNKKHGRFGFWRGQLAFKWSNSVSARTSASTVNKASGRVGQENSTRSLVLFWGRQVELGWRWLDISGMGPFFVARVKELFPTGQVERGYTWSGKKNERTVSPSSRTRANRERAGKTYLRRHAQNNFTLRGC